MEINGWVVPPFVDEHEPGPDYHCVFCSGLMQYLAHKPGAAPGTLAEAKAIRAASGLPMTGPAGSQNLVDGETKRYGWSPTIIGRGFAPLWAALTPGMCATASGNPHDAPGTPFQRWLTTYDGGHRVFLARYDDTDRAWLMDPEGPATGYTGQWVAKADIQRFVQNGASHTIAPIAEATDVVPISTYIPGNSATIKITANIRSDPKLTATRLRTLTTAETWTVIGWVKGDLDPDSGSDQWLMRWSGARYEYTAKANVTSVTVPQPTEQQLAAARAVGFTDGKTKAKAAVDSITL